jgi:hypothetical protein
MFGPGIPLQDGSLLGRLHRYCLTEKSSAHISTPIMFNTKVSSLMQHSKEHNCAKITLLNQFENLSAQ